MNVLAVLTLFSGLGFAPNVPVKTTRGTVAVLEKTFDHQIEHISIDDPFSLLGPTRGIYVNGFGAVFSTEVNLVASAFASPFRPAYNKEELAKLKQKKLQRLVVLKQQMRDMLVNSAWSLDKTPETDQVVVGVTLFYFSWEDAAGLPTQVVMRASKKVLIAVPRGNTSGLDSVIQVEEF
jgi:hypothetical protein